MTAPKVTGTNEEEILELIRKDVDKPLRQLQEGIFERFRVRKSLKWISKVKKGVLSEQNEAEIAIAAAGEETQIIRELNAGKPPVKVAENHAPETVQRVLEMWDSLKQDEYWKCHALLERYGFIARDSQQPLHDALLKLLDAFCEQNERFTTKLQNKDIQLRVLAEENQEIGRSLQEKTAEANRLRIEKEETIKAMQHQEDQKLATLHQRISKLENKISEQSQLLNSKGYNHVFIKGVRHGSGSMMTEFWNADLFRLALLKGPTITKMRDDVEASARIAAIVVAPETAKIESITYVCSACNEEFAYKPRGREYYMELMKRGSTLWLVCPHCGKKNPNNPSETLKRIGLLLLAEEDRNITSWPALKQVPQEKGQHWV